MSSFFAPNLTDNTTQITIIGPELHHMTRVMRCKVGDTVTMNSGKGWMGTGIIQSIDILKAIVVIDKVEYHPPMEPSFAIAFSLLKNKHDELLVEKVTELGAKEFFPMITRYSIRNPTGHTNKRFQSVALAAIKQCDNPYLPYIHDVTALFDTLLKVIKLGYTPVIASEYRPDKWLHDLPEDASYCFFIGAEGGFSPEEINILKGHQAQEITLSPFILRAETAAIAIAAQFNLIYR